MTATRQTICFSLAFGLLATSAAIHPQRLPGQEPREFEVLTGRAVSGSGTRHGFSATSPGNQVAGLSTRRRRTRTVSHPNVAQLQSTSSYVPSRFRSAGTRQVGGTTIMESVPGNTVYEGVVEEMPMVGESGPCVDGSCGYDAGCGGYDAGCGGCGMDSCGGGCRQCLPCPRFSLKNMQFLVGAQGFLSPRDLNTNQAVTPNQNLAVKNQSFGFHGGVNWGFHFPCMSHNFAFQLGALFVNSDYEGTWLTHDKRNQTFLTGGFYRRVDWGLQGGAVVDYVNDEWYVDHQLIQLRGEVSWVFQNHFEFGFNFAGSTRSDASLATFNALPGMPAPSRMETRESLDNYRFFVRQRFLRGGEGRVFGGWTEDGDGLIGADFLVPIHCDWAVQGGFAYVIPESDSVQAPPANYDYDNELWNVSVSLIWFPGGFDSMMHKYNRPLFNVADNGTFLQKIRQ